MKSLNSSEKKRTEKMGKDMDTLFTKEGVQTYSKSAHEKMFSITSYQDNSDETHSEMLPHTCQNG